jgi:hypothetical protein
VEERCDQRRGVEVELRQDVRDGQRMLDEVLAGDPLLARVRRLRDGVGALDQLEVGLGVVALDGADEELERLAFVGLARTQACEEASPALGPDLLATLQVGTSFTTKSTGGPNASEQPRGAAISS